MVRALVRSLTSAQFRRYSVVGFSGFIVDFGVYGVLTRCFPFWHSYYIAANFVSFTCAVINNFIWHKLWTFRPDPDPGSGATISRDAKVGHSALRQVGSQFAVFIVVSVIGLGLNSLILRLVSQQAIVKAHFGTQADFFAKAVAVPIVWFWNFGANKLWTFRKG